MANVDSVPAGKYGKVALEKLGAWDGVKDKIAQAENVRAALPARRARRGAARHRLFGPTPRRAERPDRRRFPEASIRRSSIRRRWSRDARSADAKPFLDHLKTIRARTAFEKQGFSVLVKSVTST
jgi:molybdate transport system substrate-binding protein